jgi:TusA-related sulfurtransferase
VDVRGTITPFSLLKVSLVFSQMKPGEMMEILGCDDEMRQDLQRLLPDAAWTPEKAGEMPGTLASTTIKIRKKTGKPADQ